MYYKSCEICGLRSGRKDDQRRTFMAKFPLNEARCKKWVQVIGKEDLAYIPIEKLHELKYVCGNHFRASDFKKKKTQLRKSVVPSLLITAKPLRDEVLVGFPLHVSKNNNQARKFNGTNTVLEHNYCRVIDEPKEFIQSSTENLVSQAKQIKEHETMSCTETPHSSKPVTCDTRRDTASPTKMLLLKKLNKSRKQLKVMRKKVNEIDKISSPVLKSLIKSAIKNQKRKSNGKRWDDLTKTFTLDLYKKSPEAYKYLSEVIPLPTLRTIKDLNKNKIKATNDLSTENLKEKHDESVQDDLSPENIVLSSEGTSEKTQKISICSDEIRTNIEPGVETQGNSTLFVPCNYSIVYTPTHLPKVILRASISI